MKETVVQLQWSLFGCSEKRNFGTNKPTCFGRFGETAVNNGRSGIREVEITRKLPSIIRKTESEG